MIGAPAQGASMAWDMLAREGSERRALRCRGRAGWDQSLQQVYPGSASARSHNPRCARGGGSPPPATPGRRPAGLDGDVHATEHTRRSPLPGGGQVRDHRQSRWYEEGPPKGPVGGEAISTSTSRRSISMVSPSLLHAEDQRDACACVERRRCCMCACARSGARKGSDNLAQGAAQRSPGSASAHDTRAPKGRDRRQAALRPARLNPGHGC